MFVGVGAARVRELFEQAKEKAPCMVFIDELDAIGKAPVRRMGGLGAHDEREQTLNQLLVEMDGFDARRASSSWPRRTGRRCWTRRWSARAGSTARSSWTGPTSGAARPSSGCTRATSRWTRRSTATTLAARTPGFTGADLANVVNEAALLAARREKNAVEDGRAGGGHRPEVAGLERKSRIMSEQEKVRVATHEMGHALVACGSRTSTPSTGSRSSRAARARWASP